MILLQGNNISRTFGADVLFEKINFTIQDNSRVSLVGRNGAGKSTLLKIIADVETPSSGEISKTKNLTMSYLAQETNFSSEQTIYDEMLSVFEEQIGQEKQLRQMEAQMGELSGADLSSLMTRYDSLTETFRQNKGFTYESDIKNVLNGFKFDESFWAQSVSSLSGGQKTRLALAKILLENPSFLILDEPTNHLDIETLLWLENYLKNYRGAILIVSHDRYFLDKVTTETLELSRGKLEKYVGNYSQYIKLKAEKLATQAKQYDKQQKEIASLEDFVNRNLARASTTKRAQSRRKKLEKMARLDQPLANEKSAHFTFSPAIESGNVVLTVENGAVGYDKEVLSSPINLDERKYDSIAIVGPNGIGKSTLIKSIVGKIPLIEGTVNLGANVAMGYYDQEQRDLTPSNTVLEELWKDHSLVPEVEIRNRLGAFLFSGDDVQKAVGMLSGGEKARLLLAKLSMQNDNFLVLDEPTNHLDIDSREVLENALIDFDGTLLFVSHDRYFINRVADKVLEISAEGSKLYLGDYDYYLEKKAEEAEIAALLSAENDAISEQSVPSSYQASKNDQKWRRKLTREIEALDEQLQVFDVSITELHEQMVESSEDFVKLGELQKALDAMMAEKETVEELWLEKSEELGE
ncbi:multidrug ABC transporter ATP-binding protein [Lactococcus chungangensis CAU 28 = DSM 22330]|uniref:ATP-binding cassette, subfamily F, member 3 n=1 Tax=Pseudolactococcus chungangensis CAU 28 = DSM 22330 TaxID=1122154 RepID=A0A1K2H9R4_9LACT|nr:ABC-F family ATP-binding cassette domain-containing protein [Lactococcus chungangensis]NCB81344.1 ABC transporter ATP-binding protein [Bacilli bacterium]PCS04010.1 multidrug ABC transporter ATP-binding protein [Lactococcus chungangensis CAU 28 = DSM 22330]SFZ73249.1 ATP-binding cassette, subfamily F, member 3 [Lactococcus chungangensis CAU 28 = DSM 22330]